MCPYVDDTVDFVSLSEEIGFVTNKLVVLQKYSVQYLCKTAILFVNEPFSPT